MSRVTGYYQIVSGWNKGQEKRLQDRYRVVVWMSVHTKQEERSSMKELPGCFGRWLSENSNKCETCSVQLECYGKMRREEKRREKEEERKRIPWYKLTDLEEAFGVCETCG